MDGHLSFKLKQLRQQAETRLNRYPSKSYTVLSDHNIYELEVYQTELEVQYEELERANQELHNLYQEYWDLYELAPCGYVTLDKNGLISRINQAGNKLLGLAEAKLTYPGFSKLIIPEHQHFFYDALKKAAQIGNTQSLEIKLLYTNLWAHLDIKAGFNGNSQVKQWLLTVTDVTAEKEADQSLTQATRSKLQEEQAQRKKLVNSMAECLHQSLNLAEVVEQAVTKVLEIFPATRVLVAACNPYQQMFDVVRVGIVKELGQHMTAPTLQAEYSQVKAQLRSQPVVAIDDVLAVETMHPLLADAGEARSLLAVGIWHRHRLQGFISLQVYSQPYHWQESEQQLLQQISDQLAIALQQARVYETLKAKLSEIGK